MKKIILSIFVIFSFVVLKSNAFKMQHNLVYFANDVSSVRFNMTNHCAPSSQHFDPNSPDRYGGKYIFVDVGRHATKSTATCFNQLIDNNKNHDTFRSLPGSLNFAIKGTLTLTDSRGNVHTFKDIVLAQGHHGSTNNWWFGGTHCTADDSGFANNVVTCYAQKSGVPDTEDVPGSSTTDAWCFTRGMGENMSPKNATNPNEIRVKHEQCP